jgi:hypothetical protein
LAVETAGGSQSRRYTGNGDERELP